MFGGYMAILEGGFEAGGLGLCHRWRGRILDDI